MSWSLDKATFDLFDTLAALSLTKFREEAPCLIRTALYQGHVDCDLQARDVAKARARIAELEAEVARLQKIIDSRPAINAGLPQTYIDWSQSIYVMEHARATELVK